MSTYLEDNLDYLKEYLFSLIYKISGGSKECADHVVSDERDNLLITAFTSPTYDISPHNNYEVQEYFGDNCIDTAINFIIRKVLKGMTVSEYTEMQHIYRANNTFQEHMDKLGLIPFIRAGKAAYQSNGQLYPSMRYIISDVFEALIDYISTGGDSYKGGTGQILVTNFFVLLHDTEQGLPTVGSEKLYSMKMDTKNTIIPKVTQFSQIISAISPNNSPNEFNKSSVPGEGQFIAKYTITPSVYNILKKYSKVRGDTSFTLEASEGPNGTSFIIGVGKGPEASSAEDAAVSNALQRLGDMGINNYTVNALKNIASTYGDNKLTDMMNRYGELNPDYQYFRFVKHTKMDKKSQGSSIGHILVSLVGVKPSGEEKILYQEIVDIANFELIILSKALLESQIENA